MGLDMFLNGKKFLWSDLEKPENNPKEDGFEVKEKTLRIGYWRKHPNLHGFIVQTFADGEDECQEIELDEEDILKIIDAVNGNDLPETKGFFFGSSEGHDSSEDIRILNQALEWLKGRPKGESRHIVYQASW